MTQPKSPAVRFINRQTARGLIQELRREIVTTEKCSPATFMAWGKKLDDIEKLLLGDD
jgi:hypothetical protein